MTRIVKDPKVRKKELLDIAERLFIENGYEETAVSDIVNEAKVAHGTFYHYFKSKDEVLDEITDRVVNEVANKARKAAEGRERDPLDRLTDYFRVFQTAGIGRERLMEYIHEDRNAHLHLKLENRLYPKIIPILEDIVKHGVDEGYFDTEYPRIAATSILVSTNAVSERKHDHTGKETTDPQLLQGVLYLVEKILGAKKGLFMEYLEKKGGN